MCYDVWLREKQVIQERLSYIRIFVCGWMWMSLELYRNFDWRLAMGKHCVKLNWDNKIFCITLCLLTLHDYCKLPCLGGFEEAATWVSPTPGFFLQSPLV